MYCNLSNFYQFILVSKVVSNFEYFNCHYQEKWVLIKVCYLLSLPLEISLSYPPHLLSSESYLSEPIPGESGKLKYKRSLSYSEHQDEISICPATSDARIIYFLFPITLFSSFFHCLITHTASDHFPSSENLRSSGLFQKEK